MLETGHQQYALAQDQTDPLHDWKDRYLIPLEPDGRPCIYLCGNSLGLASRRAAADVSKVMQSWGDYGVKGHFEGLHPFATYQDELVLNTTKIVGGLPGEVTIMNTLTVNIHLMLASFYRPQGRKNKILIEHRPFPSDLYALKSHIRFRGLDPDEILIEMQPREGEFEIRSDDIESYFLKYGDELALVYLGSVNYLSGQVFSFESIIQLAHHHGAMIGFDLAHGAGNLALHLHLWQVDFAVWCHYKYLNGGPNSLAGCFIHQKHHQDSSLHRLEGWWGHNMQRRFLMEPDFVPMGGIFSWQLSGPSTISLAAMKAALQDFDEAGMEVLHQKSLSLTTFLYSLIEGLDDKRLRIITPFDPAQRGCQLSIMITPPDKNIFHALVASGVILDWREPGIIRVAPVPMYNTYSDVYYFVERLAAILKSK